MVATNPMMTIDCRGVRPESKRNKNNELLLAAVILGEKGTARRLLESGLADLNAKNTAQLNCLQLAIIHNQPELAEFLIKRGIDVTNVDSRGWTALHDASLKDNADLVKTLLACGCNLEWTTLNGERPIDVAGSAEMEKLLHEMSTLCDCLNVSLSRTNSPRHHTSSAYDKGLILRSTASPVANLKRHHTHALVKTTSSGDPCSDVETDRSVYKSPTNSDSLEPCRRSASTFPPYRYREPREVCVVNSLAQSSDKERAPRKAPRESFKRQHTVSFLLEPISECGMGHPSVGRNEETSVTRKDSSSRDLCRFYESSPRSDDMDALEPLDLEVPVALLRTKPRKSSIAIPGSGRRCSDSRRRSVTFQPEVLLQDLVVIGDAQALSEALRSGVISDANLNKLSPSGLTALHQTALDGNLECAKALVQSGAHVNSVDCENCTPLHAAVMQRHPDVVRFLLENGADPAMKNSEGETPYDLAKSGTIRKMLLHATNKKCNETDIEEFSECEYTEDEEETEYSHDESDSSEDGACYFSSPTSSPRSSLQERLGLGIAEKEEVATLQNTDSASLPQTPDSVFSTQSSCLEFSFPPVSTEERRHSGSSSSCSSLVESEACKVSSTLPRTDDPDSHKSCTIADSDPDKTSEDQGFGTMEGSGDGAQWRLNFSKEDPQNALDDDLVPGTPDFLFQQACLCCDVDSALKLEKLKKDIDVNRVNKTSGITALHHCVLEENFALVQLLVKGFGANVNVQDRDGWTPLHAASAVGSIHTAQFLLDNGAKASILDNNCEFPVDVTEAENDAMFRLLERAMLGPATLKHHSCSELSISA